MTDDEFARETYLGDGLYASFDGYQIMLRAPRAGGDHHVALEEPVYQALVDYVAALKAKHAAEARK